MRVDSCKICKGTHFDKIGELCSNMKVMGPNFTEGSCEIAACSECGFVFNRYENARQRDFDDYYLSTSRTMNYYEMYPKEVADSYFLHILDELQGYVSEDSRIMDIAGGYGELAQLLAAKGYRNVSVLELKPECIQAIKAAGINAVEGNLLQMRTGREKYDLVICSHVLEHFIDLDIAMNKLRELVKPDGCVYLELPDMYRYSELDRAPYHFLTYEHVCHFSEITLHNLASQFGFKMMYLRKYIKCGDYPCLCTILKPASSNTGLSKDTESAHYMLDYIRKCEKQISAVTERFEKSQRPLILWGIGASTAQLLNHSFDGCNVIQLVDSNPVRQGIAFQIGERTLKVEAPSEVKVRDAVIFILPTAYKANIEKSIQDFGYENEIASL